MRGRLHSAAPLNRWRPSTRVLADWLADGPQAEEQAKEMEEPSAGAGRGRHCRRALRVCVRPAAARHAAARGAAVVAGSTGSSDRPRPRAALGAVSAPAATNSCPVLSSAPAAAVVAARVRRRFTQGTPSRLLRRSGATPIRCGRWRRRWPSGSGNSRRRTRRTIRLKTSRRARRSRTVRATSVLPRLQDTHALTHAHRRHARTRSIHATHAQAHAPSVRRGGPFSRGCRLKPAVGRTDTIRPTQASASSLCARTKRPKAPRWAQQRMSSR
jgi:hypothetical protein